MDASPAEIWKAARKTLHSMTTAQKVETLKGAGILTVKGNVSEPYKGVIRKSVSQSN
ncbi:hypothetical protein JIN84_03330 [Luteolibacter yonseiensis]|uniref:Uncharacterized protein n=1 Tax=Luteolibacter yonseiensis TaxID=1144680 RepID=A0A934VAQ8_9BACT|nr:hypothetical protein [Luteolibacter yonseiensis]MBK1814629.1 hypothetical protein [Luteolibacter yonseiensis]